MPIQVKKADLKAIKESKHADKAIITAQVLLPLNSKVGRSMNFEHTVP